MYIVILANTPSEAAQYAREKGLRNTEYRFAARAGSIKGLRMAEIHELPSFSRRADKHAINAALRFNKAKRIVVSFEEWGHEAGRTDGWNGIGEKPKAELPAPEHLTTQVGEQIDVFEALREMAQEIKDAGVSHPEVDAILERGADDEITSSEQIEVERAEEAEAAGAPEPSEDPAPAPKKAPKRKPAAKPKPRAGKVTGEPVERLDFEF